MAEDKATIVVLHGDMDSVFAALAIATGAAAAGMDTTLFFTFWGLNAIRKERRTGKSLMGKMVGLLNRGGIGRLPPSKFNFCGIGRRMFAKMMSDKGVPSLEELRALAGDLGVHMLACTTSMDVMEIERGDLIDEVEGVAGVAKMIKEAAESKIQLFI
ncbi:MAG: DsrE/DsrF/DrsH-like family protein [Anaerolineae bacterium]|nr:DsrE/DsrF/DrsH-like family protein [Anaerolineae bacterium]